MDFSLGVVSLGTDKKGREISTCLVREETTKSGQNTKEPGRPDEGKLGTSVRLLRRHLCDLSADSDLQPSRPIEGMITPVRAVPRSKLVTYLIKRGWFEE